MNNNNLQKFHNCTPQATLFISKKEILYLTGAEFEGFWVLCVKGNFYAICSKMIENQVQDFFTELEVKVCSSVSLYKGVLDILKQHMANSIMVDPNYMIASEFILLESVLMKEQIKLEKKIGILTNMRIIKSDTEIKNIRKACKIVSNVCEIIKKELRPNIKEIDIHYKILELFAESHVTESFSPIVACGKNSANPHHRSSNTKMRENDIVLLDIGCSYKGYCSDLTRTYFLDRIGRGESSVWHTVKKAHENVLRGIKAGCKIAWADKTARGVIAEAGFADNFIHTTGHGVGVEIHEAPSLTSNSTGIFSSHMVVTVEPGIYIKSKFGVRIEDTILIRSNDCEVMTNATY